MTVHIANFVGTITSTYENDANNCPGSACFDKSKRSDSTGYIFR